MVVIAHLYGLRTGVWAEGMFSGRGVAQSIGVLEQFTAKDRKIACRGDVMLLAGSRRQTMNGMKCRAAHAQVLSFAVHQIHKCFGTPCYFFCQSDGGIVG